MLIPAAPLTGDREIANQARALWGLQETLRRHPRARINGRLLRAAQRSVVGDSVPKQPPDGLAAIRRPVPGPQPRITDQVIRRRFRLSWLDG